MSDSLGRGIPTFNNQSSMPMCLNITQPVGFVQFQLGTQFTINGAIYEVVYSWLGMAQLVRR